MTVYLLMTDWHRSLAWQCVYAVYSTRDLAEQAKAAKEASGAMYHLKIVSAEIDDQLRDGQALNW